MVQAYGKDGFVYNGVNETEYAGAASGGDVGFVASGKAKRGGVGGRGTKSNNHKEAKVANRRRFEKH